MSLITTEQLTKTFKEETAVKDVDITIREGACTALLGPNGAGKTTTLNMIAGLMKPSRGHIAFANNPKEDPRHHLGYLPQYPKFYGWMSGLEYLIYVGELAHLPRKKAKEKAEELLSLVGLIDAKAKKIAGYSGGMKQRLGIAQALIHNPKLVILDEPVSALDPHGRREVLELMKRMKQDTSILFSTHVLHDAEEVCDDIFIMKNGEVVVNGSLENLQQKHQQPAIHVETEQDLTEWAKEIAEKQWVSQWSVDTHKLKMTVDEVTIARKEILADPSFHELKPVRFEVVKTTLEDLFMKVTQS
ncbi:ABC transporter ATP-binding protein [Alteribacter populi]|uniref:ABC transporter ATP-binding protein n=1 Tax=Alteribacter populi TaxID=2011011 RepID=UPI000BBAAA70|nr:ABC transporter ATP-binding protein [Alteribacter populi]